VRRLWRWLFGPHKRKLPALHVLSFDWCCICLIDLYEGEVWEKREHLELTGDEIPGGGSWVARTYCEEHAPADAMPPLQSRR
jgi:hypothetical protein